MCFELLAHQRVIEDRLAEGDARAGEIRAAERVCGAREIQYFQYQVHAAILRAVPLTATRAAVSSSVRSSTGPR